MSYREQLWEGNLIVKLAVWILTKELKKDRGFWDAYKSNIAVQFQDSYRVKYSKVNIAGAVARGWCSPKNSSKEMDADLAQAITDEVDKVVYGSVHEVSNNAADNFMKLWTR